MSERSPIATKDVPSVFSDERIRHLVSDMNKVIAKAGDNFDFHRLADGFRKAAGSFAEQVRTPTNSEVNAEIQELSQVAVAACETAERFAIERRNDPADLDTPFARVVELLSKLSSRARRQLNRGRASLPDAEVLHDPTRRAQACALIAGLCARSWDCDEQSNKWRLRLVALPRSYRRREAERDFVMSLQLACLNAGISIPWTASHHRRGPFARMAKKCLGLVGAPYADAVCLIQTLDRMRKPAPLDDDAKRVLRALQTGSNTQTEISKLLGGRRSKRQLEDLRTKLQERGLIIVIKEATRGRPSYVWKLPG